MSSKVDVLAKVNPTMSYIGTRVKELITEPAFLPSTCYG